MPAIAGRTAIGLAMSLAVPLSAPSSAPSSAASSADAVLAVLNDLRADPPAYAAALDAFEALFDTPVALEYHVPGDPVGRVTREGVVAVEDARAALAKQPPLPPLRPSTLLREAARDHVEEQGESGALGHLGPHGETPGLRVRRRGGDIYVAEAISYGASDAADVIRQLMIDDGVPRRGHRTILLASAYRYAGVWCGGHAIYRTMCVIDLAQTPDGSPKLPGTP